MADKFISDLTAATFLGSTDVFELDNLTNSRKITAENLAKAMMTFAPIVGCMAHKSVDETTANYSSLTAIPWTTDTNDTDGFHEGVTNPTRLTIPDLSATYGRKAKKVSLRGYVSMSSVTANEPITLSMNKNGSAALGLPFINHASPATTIGIEALAHHIPVTGDGTDYFELLLDAGADASITIASNRSCFQVWVTEWQA